MPDSLNRRLSRFAADLRFDTIPGNVLDKAKASLVHCLVMSPIGAKTQGAQRVVELTLREEGRPDGATLLVNGGTATRFGAAFANSFIIQAQNQADSYHMLVHPAACVVPAVLVTAELENISGRHVLASLVAGTEVECRLAGGFLPSTQARGFRSSSLYGTFGAAVGAARARGLDEERMVSAITWANAFTAGLGEGAHALHEANGTRNGVLASMLASEGFPGYERALDGPAGFYNAFTGNSEGRLTYAFPGPSRVDLSNVADELGERWEMLHVTPKVPPTPGYAIPVIELVKQMQREHGFTYAEVATMQVLSNWLETSYPSPAFVDPDPSRPNRPGGTAHAAAYVCVHGDYPVAGLTPGQATDSAVLDLMGRIEVLGVWDRVPFAPRITVRLRDGRVLDGEFQGNELEWDLDTELTRLREVSGQVGWPQDRFDAIVEAVQTLERAETVDGLIALCVQ